MRFYVLSCNGCMNAIRCWIGGCAGSPDVASLAFNLNRFSTNHLLSAPAIL